MAGRPPGGQPSHHDNLIDFDDSQPAYYSGARPPVNDEELLHRYDINPSDTHQPQARPSISYDDFVGGGRPTAGLPGGPGAPPAGETPYSTGGGRLYSQSSELHNYQRYSDADIPAEDDHSMQGYYASGNSYDAPELSHGASKKPNRNSILCTGLHMRNLLPSPADRVVARGNVCAAAVPTTAQRRQHAISTSSAVETGFVLDLRPWAEKQDGASMQESPRAAVQRQRQSRELFWAWPRVGQPCMATRFMRGLAPGTGA